MKQYHKIQTIFKRDMSNKGKIIIGDYSEPYFDYLKDNKWVFTEKVDGTNIRVMWNGENVVFGGKTDNAQMPTFLLYKLQSLFEGTVKKQLFLKQFPQEGDVKPQVCLYGEGYGAKIQSGGKYIPDGVDFVLFDVLITNVVPVMYQSIKQNKIENGLNKPKCICRKRDMWLLREDVEEIAKVFNIKIVPIIGEGTLNECIEIVKKGFNSQWGNFEAEGIVAKPKVELKDRRGNRIITKIKSRDFKLI